MILSDLLIYIVFGSALGFLIGLTGVGGGCYRNSCIDPSGRA